LLCAVAGLTAYFLGPSDRMPEYPRLDLSERTLPAQLSTWLACLCALAFAVSLPNVGRTLRRVLGSGPSAIGPAVFFAIWAIARFASSFADPYRELSLTATTLLPLAVATLWAGRVVSRAHALLSPVSAVTSLLLLAGFASRFFSLQSLPGPSGETIWGDPSPFAPGGVVYLLALGAACLWFIATGAVLLARARTYRA